MDTKNNSDCSPSKKNNVAMYFQSIFHFFIIKICSWPVIKLVALGYLSYITAGWILLCLPWLQKGIGVSALDCLFISTSGVSTTGLVTISISDNFTFLGQFIILLLIQLGGIGYMTLGSFIVLARKNELTDFQREIGQAVYSLPKSFNIERFIKEVIWFTITIEFLGACLLYPILRHAGAISPIWSAIFHSISAFCTAGFSIYNNSFESMAGNFWINIVLAILSYLGSMGFIVCADYWRVWRGQSNQVTLTSKVILVATFILSLSGTVLFFLQEPTIQQLAIEKRILAAFFQCMTAMTTVGFNTISICSLSKASVLLLVLLMIIGASPSGTGGGIKTTTISAFLGVILSAMQGKKRVRFWGKLIPLERIWMACGSLGFYLLCLIIGTYLLFLTEKISFDQLLFEAASAIGTVGLSMGITSNLTGIGKIIIIILMYCGRVGPLTFGAALFCRKHDKIKMIDSDLAV